MANGLLGKIVSSTNQFVQAYQVPIAGVEFATVSIHVLNKNASIAHVDIAVGMQATPEDVDFISFKDELVAEGGVVEHNCFLMSPGERVLVRSDNAETIIRVHGLEKLAIA